VDEDTARRLLKDDPAVRAGRLEAVVLPWMVPAGTANFSPTRLPRSKNEVG
jgi:hypothetical protein